MSKHRRLIVNADGFGFGHGATEGIFDALREGRFISSVSVNSNFPEAERITDLCKEFPHVSVGVHLNPMVGAPCLPPEQVPSLVSADGYFLENKFLNQLKAGSISLQELELEFDAQIEKVRRLVGDRLTHLDSQGNRHLHYLNLFLSLGRKWKLRCMRNNSSLICLEAKRPRISRLRVYLWKPQVWLAHCYRKIQMQQARLSGMRMADNLVTVGYAGIGGKTKLGNWIRILENLPIGTYEIYCHPAYPDDTLRRWSYYSEERGKELEVLRKSDLRATANNLGLEIINFNEL